MTASTSPARGLARRLERAVKTCGGHVVVDVDVDVDVDVVVDGDVYVDVDAQTLTTASAEAPWEATKSEVDR